MVNFLMACGAAAANTAANVGGGCYDWPVIKQIISLFGWVIGYIFKFFDMLGIGNIGLVIIVFTLLVKFALLPLTIKQQKFTKLNSILQPEIKAIQNKYKGKNDTLSMSAQQAEMKEVYAKYGTSQTGGCLQTGIQMPIIIALFGVLRQLPSVLNVLSTPLSKVVDILGKSGIDFSTISASLASGVSLENKMAGLYSLSAKGWEALTALLPAAQASQVTELHNQVLSVNTFLGIDISQTPWVLIKGGGIGIVAIILPIIAGFCQWLSFKLTQTKESAGMKDMTSGMTNSMGLMMPLFSVFLCFTMNAGLGLYWAASSLFQVVLQIIINRSYRKMDMKEFVAKNLAKAEEKAKKKKQHAASKNKGVNSADIVEAANIVTKRIDTETEQKELAKKAKKEGQKPLNPNSLAAKAGLVAQYNEEHGEEIVDVESKTSTKRKYKK